MLNLKVNLATCFKFKPKKLIFSAFKLFYFWHVYFQRFLVMCGLMLGNLACDIHNTINVETFKF